jgi:DNA-binding LytR/AlgR family response regulator
VLVVDDEAPARRRLRRLLQDVAGVEVVGEAEDGHQARALVERLRPDLVLLDIHMPEIDGLTLAATTAMPAVVFTTAHAEHAVRAFELAAVDYLLKPIDGARLRQAVERARTRQALPDWSALRDVVARGLGHTEPARRTEPARLTARLGNTVHLFDIEAVTRLHATDKYVLLQHESREFVLDESLVELEARLGPHGFVRVHRSELVRVAAIRALHLEPDGAWVELTDGQRAPVSRRSLPSLRQRLGLP